jgi:hypothetical protein
MGSVLIRLLIFALVSGGLCLVVVLGRRFVESRRQRALAAAPLPAHTSTPGDRTAVRILAFSSDDCVQCHRMQTPALRRVLDARPDVVVEEIDAPRAPELTRRYSVLTVPTTVVLDAAGRARAVNYGFADTRRLLEQVEAALATAADAEGGGDVERIKSAC